MSGLPDFQAVASFGPLGASVWQRAAKVEEDMRNFSAYLETDPPITAKHNIEKVRQQILDDLVDISHKTIASVPQLVAELRDRWRPGLDINDVLMAIRQKWYDRTQSYIERS